MAETYVVAVEGLAGLKSIDELPAGILRAAVRAVNATTRRAYAASGREMRRQINFPARYLTGQDGRLRVKKTATSASLEGVIEGRQRPTSLARFVTSGAPGPRQKGVRVAVKPGASRFMRRGFLLKLRAGNAAVDTKFNLGLAIRLKAGESIRNKREVIQMSKNLYLLYGPSVDQVFKTVAEDIAPEMAGRLEEEFLRLLEL